MRYLTQNLKTVFYFGTLISLWLAPLLSQAAIINFESMRSSLEEIQGFSASVDNSFETDRGNVDLTSLRFDSLLKYNVGPHQWLFFTNARYGESKGQRDISHSTAHARWVRRWTPTWSHEVYIQHQFNEFKSLQARFVAGGGVRIVFIDTDTLQLSLGSGYIFDYEKLDISSADSHRDLTRDHRSTNYINFKWLFDKKIHLSQVMYFQPRFDRLSDFRLSTQTELEFIAKEWLSFSLALNIFYDNDPPDEVEDTDTHFSSKVRFKF